METTVTINTWVLISATLYLMLSAGIGVGFAYEYDTLRGKIAAFVVAFFGWLLIVTFTYIIYQPAAWLNRKFDIRLRFKFYVLKKFRHDLNVKQLRFVNASFLQHKHTGVVRALKQRLINDINRDNEYVYSGFESLREEGMWKRLGMAELPYKTNKAAFLEQAPTKWFTEPDKYFTHESFGLSKKAITKITEDFKSGKFTK